MAPQLGDISLCLNVTDLTESAAYYLQLGFVEVGGTRANGWVILRYGDFELGLFQGHIPANMLHFRGPDPASLAPLLHERGIEPDSPPFVEPDGSHTLLLSDPDGNKIYINSFPGEIAEFMQRQARPGELCEAIFYVQDMAAQVAFYRDVMGLNLTYPTQLADYSAEMWVTFATGACTLALHGGGAGQIGRDAPKLVFAVGDMQAARARLLERGVALGEIRSPASGVLVSDGRDPEGNAFSLEQRG